MSDSKSKLRTCSHVGCGEKGGQVAQVGHELFDDLPRPPLSPCLVLWADEAMIASHALLYPHLLHELRARVEPRHLVNATYRAVYAACVACFDALGSVGVTPETVRVWLSKQDDMPTLITEEIVGVTDRAAIRDWHAMGIPDGVCLAAVRLRNVAAQREILQVMHEARAMAGPGVRAANLVRLFLRQLWAVCEAYGLGTLHFVPAT